MKNKILPIPPQLTKEYFMHNSRVKSKAVYITLVLLIIGTLVMLPLVKVTVSVQGRGVVRPVTEISEVRAVASERVDSVFRKEGDLVQAGDTILTLQNDAIQSKIQFVRNEMEKVQMLWDDTKLLSSNYRASEHKIFSQVYRQQYQTWKESLNEYQLKIDKAARERQRIQQLFEKDIVAQKEFDDVKVQYEQLTKEKEIFTTKQLAIWKKESLKLERESEQLKSRLRQFNKELSLYTITSPVEGTIEQFKGIYSGSIIYNGQSIAQISPKSEMIAEIYVSAKDIGYLHRKQTAIIQIDAFNYNEWGCLQGAIASISDDYILLDNIPFFKVKCNLKESVLTLKNGTTGKLRKGMTLNSRFLIARRSLFQLIYQKSDDWLNPTRHTISQAQTNNGLVSSR